jgi:hypothetical protein
MCQSASADETTELLEGYADRCKILEIAPAKTAVVDNCCHVRSKIKKALPDINVVLDVWHFQKRCVKRQVESDYFMVLVCLAHTH